MNMNVSAWMIAGGVDTDPAEVRRREHLLAIARIREERRPGTIARIRDLLAAATAGRTTARRLAPDCCTA